MNRKKVSRKKKRRIQRMRRLLILACVLLVLLNITALAGVIIYKVMDQSTQASITVAGDVMLHSPMLRSTYYYNSETNAYDFSSIFKYIEEDYKKADYTVCTFEGALGGGDYIGFENFISPPAIMSNLKNSGIDLCLLASNHLYDGYDEGLHATMDFMDQIKFNYLGIRQSTDIKPYKVQNIEGIKVGMVDYVYEAGNYKTINWKDVSDASDPLISSFNYNTLDQFYAEAKNRYEAMKNDGAEVCMIYLHWGTEYSLTQSSTQESMAQALCDIGYNLIIGSHPHVIQPVDVLTSTDGSHQTFVAYAIGNHLSNQRYEYLSSEANGETEDGMMVNIKLSKDFHGNVEISDISFTYTWVYMQTTDDNNQYYILPLDDLEALNDLPNLGTDPQDSINRTNKILGDSINKVKNALPIAVPEN